MTKILSAIRPRFTSLCAVFLGVFLGTFPQSGAAQIYGGRGIVGGIADASTIFGITALPVDVVIFNLLLTVLGYMALAAVVVIVIAGIYMVLSVGDDSAKDKAKKIIGFAAGGLIIIALASAFVALIAFATGSGTLFGIIPNLGAGNSPEAFRTTTITILTNILVFLGLAAVVVIVIAGIYMVVGMGEESSKDKAKKIITYAIIGLIIVALAGSIVAIVTVATGAGGLFGPIPDLGTGNDPEALRATTLRILLEILSYMALAAVVVIAIAGIYMVVGMGEESSKDKAKKIITYAIIGLIIIALAAGIVLLIITATGAGGLFGPVPDLGATGGTDIRATIIATLRAVLNFMALAAVVMIVIAGIILVVSGGDEQMKDKAKRIILYTFIGLIIILMASAIVFIFSNAAG
ncbi:MAG: hypothetical protein QF442_03905 [Candidatus Peribacteraceae bacterium]|nr:hypothetical protein [Candidatus Peribacteraceae bacterium]